MPDPCIPDSEAFNIESVAKNARISLSDSEKKKFQSELNAILIFFSEIALADIEITQPSFQPVAIKNVLREDKIKKSLPQKDALKNCVETKEGFIKGPKI